MDILGDRTLSHLYIVLACFCIKVSVAQPAIDAIIPPALNVYTDQLTVPEGGPLEIMCEGNRPLSWSVPASRYQSTPLVSRMKVNETTLATQEGRTWYLSVLTVPTLEYMDTGGYNCTYAAGLGQPPAIVYVFVPNADSLFLKSDLSGGAPKFAFLSLSQGRPSDLPCRVTDPRATVTLENDDTGRTYEYSDDLTFDPRTGVTIVYPTPQFTGAYTCRATTENATDEFKLVLMYQPSTIPPQPVLEILSGDDGNILVGERLLIRCYVDVMIGTSSYIEFLHPAEPSRVTTTRTKTTPITHNGRQYERHEKNLTVGAILGHEGGMYTCLVKHHDNQNQRARAVYVHERAFIWLIPIQLELETFLGAKHIDLSVTIEAYPDPRLEWYRDGKLITADDRRFDIRSRPDRSRLRIHNVMLSDAGAYTIKARNRETQADVDITLKVLALPTVEVTSPDNHPFYIENEYYTLTSHYAGVPSADGYVQWQVCANPGCSPDPGAWGSVDQSYNLPNVAEASPGESTITLRASQTGFFRCVVTNKIGTNASEPLHFIVTDVANGFGHYYANTDIQGEYLRPVVGDKVIVICKASPIAFLPPKMYRERGSGQEMEMLNNSRRHLVSQETSLAHILTLTFISVDARDDGWYKCKTSGFLNDQHESAFNLQTRDAQFPVFTKPLAGTMHLEAGVDHSLECGADGDPPPALSWARDGQPLVTGGNPVHGNLEFNDDYTRLTIQEISLNDSGVYACTAKNRVGSVTSNVTLIIKTSLEITDGRGLSKANIGILIGILFGLLVILAILLVIFVLRKKRRKPKYQPIFLDEYLQPAATAKFNPELPVDEQTECLSYDPRWEIPRDNLVFDIVLGQGAFGKVMRADFGPPKECEIKTQVAVKMVKDVGDREQLKALLSELKVLIHIGQHVNLVNLVGAVTRELEKGHLHVVVEYCRFGNLRQYLTKKRGNFVDTMDDAVKQNALNALAKRREAEETVIPPPEDDDEEADPESPGPSVSIRRPKYPKPYRGPSLTTADTAVTYLARSDGVTTAGATGASGMSYASRFSCDEEIPLTTKDLICYAFQIARGMEYLASKKYIHRDLAARNILLSDDNVVKICDFGLAKDCYKYDEYKKTSDGPVPVRWMAIESLTHKIYTTKSDVWSYAILLWEIFTIGGTPYPAIDMDETFINRLRGGYRLEKPKHAPEDVFRVMQQCWAAEPEDRPHFDVIAETFGNFLQDTVKQFYMDLSTMYSKIQSGEDYVNMRGSEYMPMVTDDDDDNDDDSLQGAAAAAPPPKVKVDTRKGNVYYNSDQVSPPRGRDENRPLMGGTNLRMVDERPNGASNGASNAPLMLPRAKQQPITAKLGENSGDHSVKSNASSGFHSDYHSDDVAVPPRYSAVQKDGGASVRS